MSPIGNYNNPGGGFILDLFKKWYPGYTFVVTDRLQTTITVYEETTKDYVGYVNLVQGREQIVDDMAMLLDTYKLEGAYATRQSAAAQKIAQAQTVSTPAYIDPLVARGQKLDMIGNLFRFSRKPGEPDADFRVRLLEAMQNVGRRQP